MRDYEIYKLAIMERIGKMDATEQRFLRQLYTIIKRHVDRKEGKE